MIVNVTLLFPASNESISHLHFIFCSVTYFFLLLLSTHRTVTLFFSFYSHTSLNQPATFFLNTHSFTTLDDSLAPSVLLASFRIAGASVNVRPFLRGVPPSAPHSSFPLPHSFIHSLSHAHATRSFTSKTLHTHYFFASCPWLLFLDSLVHTVSEKVDNRFLDVR